MALRFRIPGTQFSLSSDVAIRRVVRAVGSVETFSRAGVECARTALAKAGVDRRYFKIFAIGFNKTATSSIHRVLESAGIVCLHNPKWIEQGNTRLLWTHRAFSDGAPLNFEKLDRRFPRAKFMLNVRELDEWLDSRLTFVRMQIDSGRIKPQNYWTDTPEAVDAWIRGRNRHHLAVMRYFRDRPEDLLVLNYIRDPDAVEKIAAFTGLPVASGKLHVRPSKVKLRESGVLTRQALIHERLQAAGVAECEYGNDLFCPSLVKDGNAEGLPADTSQLAGSVFDPAGPGGSTGTA